MSRFFHDPVIAGLADLGVSSVAQLLGPEQLPAPRAEIVAELPGRTRMRYPLPGTPATPAGPPTGPAGGGGTGWVVLDRFTRSPWRALAVSRLTNPRSASLAERRWNILCHLRANGVGTPEPLAVGARGVGPVARDSFLLTRELEEFEPAGEWLAQDADPARRRRGLRAIGSALAKLLGARVFVPGLSPAHVHVSKTENSEAAGCDWKAELAVQRAQRDGSLRMNRMPSVALVDVEEASIQGRLSAGDVATMLRGLDTPSLELTERERVYVAHIGLRNHGRAFRAEVRSLAR